eukprot:m.164463 g.164463  ORF g.164463 m.164463 type:complete len:287 (+) comp21058_c0_seq4:119-979(+)
MNSLLALGLLALAGLCATEEVDQMLLDPSKVLYMQLKSGTVVIRMRDDLAPKHVERISLLVRSGFYDGLFFHRVIEGFMAQGGDPQGDGRGGTRIHIPAEFSKPSVARHERGAVNMARYAGDDDSADSQFSIMFHDSFWLDEEYTLWGHVLAGMEHVDAIKKGDPHDNGAVSDPMDEIISIRIPGDEDPSCVDLDNNCVNYAQPGAFSYEGECLNNPDWMNVNCPLSCGKCKVPDTVDVPCGSLYKMCGEWATPGQFSDEGECVNNPAWMLKNCRKDCDSTCFYKG